MVQFYHALKHPNDAEGMANNVDPDQTAPDPGSTLLTIMYVSFGYIPR